MKGGWGKDQEQMLTIRDGRCPSERQGSKGFPAMQAAWEACTLLGLPDEYAVVWCNHRMMCVRQEIAVWSVVSLCVQYNGTMVCRARSCKACRRQKACKACMLSGLPDDCHVDLVQVPICSCLRHPHIHIANVL